MADKKVIIKFKKTASTESKDKIVDELKAKGADIHNADSINSKIFPFVVVTIGDDHFDALRSASLHGGHDVIDHVEEDQEVHIL